MVSKEMELRQEILKLFNNLNIEIKTLAQSLQDKMTRINHSHPSLKDEMTNGQILLNQKGNAFKAIQNHIGKHQDLFCSKN